MGSLATNPSTVVQAADEDIAWGIDLTAPAGAYPVTNVLVVLVDKTTGLAVTLTDPPTVNGKTVTQRVRAGTLAANGTYRMAVKFTQGGTTNILETILTIYCPFNGTAAGSPAPPVGWDPSVFDPAGAGIVAALIFGD